MSCENRGSFFQNQPPLFTDIKLLIVLNWPSCNNILTGPWLWFLWIILSFSWLIWNQLTQKKDQKWHRHQYSPHHLKTCQFYIIPPVDSWYSHLFLNVSLTDPGIHWIICGVWHLGLNMDICYSVHIFKIFCQSNDVLLRWG